MPWTGPDCLNRNECTNCEYCEETCLKCEGCLSCDSECETCNSKDDPSWPGNCADRNECTGCEYCEEKCLACENSCQGCNTNNNPLYDEECIKCNIGCQDGVCYGESCDSCDGCNNCNVNYQDEQCCDNFQSGGCVSCNYCNNCEQGCNTACNVKTVTCGKCLSCDEGGCNTLQAFCSIGREYAYQEFGTFSFSESNEINEKIFTKDIWDEVIDYINQVYTAGNGEYQKDEIDTSYSYKYWSKDEFNRISRELGAGITVKAGYEIKGTYFTSIESAASKLKFLKYQCDNCNTGCNATCQASCNSGVNTNTCDTGDQDCDEFIDCEEMTPCCDSGNTCCDSNNMSDTCEGCNGCEGVDTCDTCLVTDTCNSCLGTCEGCDQCEDGCDTCDFCQGNNTCLGCDSGDCYFCDNCDQSCNDCNACEGTSEVCTGCNTCQTCNAGLWCVSTCQVSCQETCQINCQGCLISCQGCQEPAQWDPCCEEQGQAECGDNYACDNRQASNYSLRNTSTSTTKSSYYPYF